MVGKANDFEKTREPVFIVQQDVVVGAARGADKPCDTLYEGIC